MYVCVFAQAGEYKYSPYDLIASVMNLSFPRIIIEYTLICFETLIWILSKYR